MAGEKTKNRIIEVATMMFGRYGFNKTSMDEIAKTANKAKGSLYYHFEGKEELFAAVVERELNHLKEELLPVVNDPGLSADIKIKKYLLTRMKILNSAVNYQEAIKPSAFQRFDFVTVLRQDIENWERQQIKAILTQGINEGIFDNINKSMEIILDVFFIVQKGLEVPFYLQGNYENYLHHFDDLLNILIKGLSK